MTVRLQKVTKNLVDGHQTGFLQGRSIAESFIHAVELSQHCHTRKIPSLAIKLDFAKAFDNVHWDGLLQILQARGFQQKWREWILNLLASTRSTNGPCQMSTPALVPGSPANVVCVRVTRYRHIYSSLLVADMLQQMIKAISDSVRHPLTDGLPCPVLQFADDTLVVIRGEPEDVQSLKSLLDNFAAATGLKINFDKTTAVPIHMNEAKAMQCVSILS